MTPDRAPGLHPASYAVPRTAPALCKHGCCLEAVCDFCNDCDRNCRPRPQRRTCCLDGRDSVRCDCASPHRVDPSGIATAGLLLGCLFGGLLFLLLVTQIGWPAMCAAHDGGLSYCPGYSDTLTEDRR